MKVNLRLFRGFFCRNHTQTLWYAYQCAYTFTFIVNL